jgi:hypothetical protein
MVDLERLVPVTSCQAGTSTYSSGNPASMVSLCQEGKSSRDALWRERKEKSSESFSSRSCLSGWSLFDGEPGK